MIGLSGIASTTFVQAAPRGVSGEQNSFFSSYVEKVSSTVKKIGNQVHEFLNKRNPDPVATHIKEFKTLLVEVHELIDPLAPHTNEDESLRLTYEILQEVEKVIHELLTTIEANKSKGHLMLGIALRKVKSKFSHLEIKVIKLSQSVTCKEIEDCIKQLAAKLPTSESDILLCLKHRLECR